MIKINGKLKGVKKLNIRVIIVLIAFLILYGIYTSNSEKYPYSIPIIEQYKEKVMDWVFNREKEIYLTYPEENNRAIAIELDQQLRGHNGYFVVVVEGGATVYSGPDQQTTVATILPGSTRIRTLHIAQDFKDGSKQWVFAGNEETGHPLGWIKRNELVFKNDFKKVTDWTLNYFGFCKGEYCGQMLVSKDGFYKNDWYAKGQGLYLRGLHQGKLFEHDGIIWAKKAKSDRWVDLFLLPTDGGEFSHEEKYSDQTIRIFKNQPRLKK